ncbi:winged helix-turn-helix transcriptional regulator [Leclercia adecarboxylata]|uniref:winged helix-turn-helix transcriptional regulator n=1 Tax=Leclercia adecarboxylata TaxID=83655 RepID=UPI00370A88B2
MLFLSVNAALLVRHDYREIPHKVEYEIIDFRRTLARALQPLCEWGKANREYTRAAERHDDKSR